jgi:hypothetical protein
MVFFSHNKTAVAGLSTSKTISRIADESYKIPQFQEGLRLIIFCLKHVISLLLFCFSDSMSLTGLMKFQ